MVFFSLEQVSFITSCSLYIGTTTEHETFASVVAGAVESAKAAGAVKSAEVAGAGESAEVASAVEAAEVTDTFEAAAKVSLVSFTD